MKSVKCSICDREAKFGFVSVRDDSGLCDSGYTFYHCEDCNYYFIHPIPDEKQISQYYNDHPILTNQVDLEDDVISYLRREKTDPPPLISEVKLKLKDAIKNNFGKGGMVDCSVLDIGCNTGVLLHFLRENLNVDVTGVEINEKAIQVGKKHLNLTTVFPDIYELRDKRKKFDVITLIDVIEHLPDPLGFLDDAKSLLSDNGFIFLRFPCTDGLLFNRNRPSSWKWVYAPYHLSLLSRQSIRNIAEKCGMSPQIVNDDLTELNPEIIFIKLTSEYKFLKKPVLKKLTSLFSKFAYLCNLYKSQMRSTETIFVILTKN